MSEGGNGLPGQGKCTPGKMSVYHIVPGSPNRLILLNTWCILCCRTSKQTHRVVIAMQCVKKFSNECYIGFNFPTGFFSWIDPSHKMGWGLDCIYGWIAGVLFINLASWHLLTYVIHGAKTVNCLLCLHRWLIWSWLMKRFLLALYIVTVKNMFLWRFFFF